MADHTIKNLREVEDSAVKFGHAPDVSARFAAGDLELSTSGLSLQRLAPNVTQPFGHRHKEQEELYIVVDGTGRAKVEDEVIKLHPWDALRVAPRATRAFSAGPDGLEFLAFGAPAIGDKSAEAEMEPDWWEG